MSPYIYSLRFPLLWWFGGASLVALIIYGSLATSGLPTIPVTHFDKVQHVVAYCVLGVYFGGIVKRRALWGVLFLLLLMSVGLEFLQGAGGQRMFDPYDMAFNAVGLAIGKKLCRLGLRGWCQIAERLVLA